MNDRKEWVFLQHNLKKTVNSNASLQNPAPDIITGPYMIVFEILISFRIIEVKRKN